MYLPYIRGRQYELLALRELVTNDLLGDYVIPIIEPVKLSPTLIKTIAEYIRVGHQLAVIRNPGVGSFKEDIQEAKHDSKEGVYKSEFQKLYDDDIIIKSIMEKIKGQIIFFTIFDILTPKNSEVNNKQR